MYQFKIEDRQFKIVRSASDDAVWFSELDNGGNWIGILNQNTDSVEAGRKSVDEFLNEFISKVNIKLDEFFGKVETPVEFKTPLEELDYRIANNLNLVGINVDYNK